MRGRMYEQSPEPKRHRPASRIEPARHQPGMACWRVERVARYLDISKKRVYQLVQEGRLEAIRLGPRQMRILRRSLEDYVATLLKRAKEDS